MHRIFVALLLCACTLAQPVRASIPEDSALLMPQPFQNWKTLQTEHFRINYRDQHLAFAQRLAAVAETVYAKQTPRLQWEPAKPTEVVIIDSYDGSNGGASVLPFNRFFIFMNAPVDGELLDNSPWIEQVFTHEFVHILHLDQSSGGQTFLRNVFGRFFFAFPQIFSPSWVSEGIAVYEETDVEKGFGRGQSVFYDAMMRAEYLKGFRSFSQTSYQGYWGTDWPSGQVYLYGYYFFEFLTAQYGEDKAFEYLRNWNNNIIPWRMQARAKEVFGVSAEALWDQFETYLDAKFGGQMARLPVVEYDEIVADGRVNGNPVWLADGNLYYYREDGRQHPSLQQVSAEGEDTKLSDVVEFLQFDVHPQAGVLMSRHSICNNVDVYADLYRLQDNGRWQRITECGRYPRIAWSHSGQQIAAVHTDRGLSQIAILDERGTLLQMLPTLGQGEVIGHIAWSPDDRKLVAAVRRERSGWNLEILDLARNLWTPLTRNTHLEQRPRFSADGQWVYFISDREGLMNLRRLRLADGQVQTVTRTQTAILDYSLSDDEQRVRVVEYSPDGWRIREQALQPWGSEYAGLWQERAPLQSIVNQPGYSVESYTGIEDYSPLHTIAPTSWFAFLYADSDDNNWIQFILQGQDVLGYHQWQLAPAYYFDKEKFGGSLAYIAYHRLALLAEREWDTIQDEEAGAPGIWREETRYQAVWQQPFNSFDGSFEFDLGMGKEDVKRIIDDVEFDSYEDNFVGLSLNWSDYEYYLHSISVEDGRRIKLQAEHYNAFGDGYHEGDVYSLDWREYLSLFDNHVLALRMVLGQADDTAKSFQLGNELDELQTLGASIGFGRTGYTLRGYSDNQAELEGDNLRLYSLEYRLPLGEWFDGLTSLPVGLGKAGVHVFVDHGAAWDSGDSHEFYTGVGVELRPDLLIGYSTFKLESTLGYARGLDDEIGESTLYLRLGANF
ncbi:MAG: hypothetical protein VYA55_05745 [Pseudomonadota bacterium]|nr:hypothetical protein [Pseudomonadota bacterium]